MSMQFLLTHPVPDWSYEKVENWLPGSHRCFLKQLLHNWIVWSMSGALIFRVRGWLLNDGAVPLNYCVRPVVRSFLKIFTILFSNRYVCRQGRAGGLFGAVMPPPPNEWPSVRNMLLSNISTMLVTPIWRHRMIHICYLFSDEGKATYREHTQPVKIFTVGPFASIWIFITGNLPSSIFLFVV